MKKYFLTGQFIAAVMIFICAASLIPWAFIHPCIAGAGAKAVFFSTGLGIGAMGLLLVKWSYNELKQN